MTNKEILEKAIAKAIEGGWQEPDGNTLSVDDDGRLFSFLAGASDGIRAYGYQFNLERLIYSHDFAKALWGEEDVDLTKLPNNGVIPDDPIIHNYPLYRHHLMQMVIAENPFEYLEKNI